MCGRFYFGLGIDEVIESFNIDCNISETVQKGEKFPGTKIPVIFNRNGKKMLVQLDWGIKYNETNIINIRFETAEEKPLFKGLINYSRCIIPATLFYEWKSKGKSKEKMEISARYNNIISLAGIYGQFQDEKDRHYTAVAILTVPAAESLTNIHHRMPLIISKRYTDTWLKVGSISSEITGILQDNYAFSLEVHSADNIEQISFFS